jgi:hypothetical protein
VYEEDGAYYLWDYGGLDHRKRLVVLNWAGISAGPTMPARQWYVFFRYKNLSAVYRIMVFILDKILLLFEKPKNALVSNKFANTSYHKVKRSIGY